jgi:hypothetical protein
LERETARTKPIDFQLQAGSARSMTKAPCGPEARARVLEHLIL